MHTNPLNNVCPEISCPNLFADIFSSSRAWLASSKARGSIAPFAIITPSPSPPTAACNGREERRKKTMFRRHHLRRWATLHLTPLPHLPPPPHICIAQTPWRNSANESTKYKKHDKQDAPHITCITFFQSNPTNSSVTLALPTHHQTCGKSRPRLWIVEAICLRFGRTHFLSVRHGRHLRGTVPRYQVVSLSIARIQIPSVKRFE